MHWFLEQYAQVLVDCDETGWMFVALRSSALGTSSVAFLGRLTESGPYWTKLAGVRDARRPFRGGPGVMDTRRQSTPGRSKRQPPLDGWELQTLRLHPTASSTWRALFLDRWMKTFKLGPVTPDTWGRVSQIWQIPRLWFVLFVANIQFFFICKNPILPDSISY